MRPPSAMRALLVMAAARLLLHTLTNGQYAFHRDELATLDDARHLAWGYVAYPPLTPFLARVAMEWFGSTPAAIRFFTALAQCTAMVVGGLLARELGGSPPGPDRDCPGGSRMRRHPGAISLADPVS